MCPRITSHSSPATTRSCLHSLYVSSDAVSSFIFILLSSLPASTSGLLLNFDAQIAIAFVSFHAIRMLNSAVSRCVNYINRCVILFSLIKTRTKPDGNGRLAEAGTPKRAMKTTTL